MYYKYFVAATLGLFLGTVLVFKINFSSEIFLIFLIISLLNIFLYKFSKRSQGVYKSKIPILIFCFSLAMAVGILLGQNDLFKDQERKIQVNNLIKKNSENNSVTPATFAKNNVATSSVSAIRITGRISEISYTENSQIVILITEEILEQNLEQISGQYNLQIFTNRFPELQIGDSLKVTGNLQTENNLQRWPDSKHNFKTSLISNSEILKNIDLKMYFPTLEKLESQKTEIKDIADQKKNISKNIPENIKITLLEKFWVNFLPNLKKDFLQILKNNLETQTAALSVGTLLGDNSLFSKSELQNFRAAGLSHIIVLSGFNIAIIIVCLSTLFSFLPLTRRLCTTFFFMIIFIFLVGPSPSIIRATIMGSILLLANIYGRQYMARQALFISAMLMIIINPKISLYDISFHLSFFATLGILYLNPILHNLISTFQKFTTKTTGLQSTENSFSPESKNNFSDNVGKNILEIFLTTTAAQIAVTPYLMYVFSKISLFGIFANILAVPVIPIIMLFGFLIIFFFYFYSLIIGLNFTLLAFFPKIFLIIFGYLNFIFCKYVFLISEFVANLPHSQIQSSLSGFAMSVIYVILIFLILLEEKRKRMDLK